MKSKGKKKISDASGKYITGFGIVTKKVNDPQKIFRAEETSLCYRRLRWKCRAEPRPGGFQSPALPLVWIRKTSNPSDGNKVSAVTPFVRPMLVDHVWYCPDSPVRLGPNILFYVCPLKKKKLFFLRAEQNRSIFYWTFFRRLWRTSSSGFWIGKFFDTAEDVFPVCEGYQKLPAAQHSGCFERYTYRYESLFRSPGDASSNHLEARCARSNHKSIARNFWWINPSTF